MFLFLISEANIGVPTENNPGFANVQSTVNDFNNPSFSNIQGNTSEGVAIAQGLNEVGFPNLSISGGGWCIEYRFLNWC